MSDNNKCLACGTEMNERLENVKYDEAGLGVTLINVPVNTCPKCGEREVGVRSMESLHKQMAKMVAEKQQRLMPNEIRFLRKYLGFSSADFADTIGVDKATVYRWQNEEDPQQMSLPVEKFLRFLALNEKPVDAYPLKEMATKDAAPLRAQLELGNRGWRPTRAA